MKKHVLFIATAAAMLAGCAKEVEKPAKEQTGKLYTITALVDNPETRTVTEYNSETNKYKFSWEANELISVVSVNPSAVLLFQVADASNGLFNYTAMPDEPDYTTFGMAVTPANALVENNPTPNNFSVQLSGDYLYGLSNALMIAGEPTKTGDNYKFQFKHAAALVQVTYNDIPVGTKAMVLTAKDEGNVITGTASLTSAPGSVAMSNLSGTTSNVARVNYTSALTEAKSSDVFYVPIPTGSYKTFEIKLVDDSDNVIPGSTFDIDAGSLVNVVVGNVLMLPAKTVETITPPEVKYYTKVTSSDNLGDGQYLIVYEEGSVAFNGGLGTLDAVSNTIDVTIDGATIESNNTTDAASFYIDFTSGTIQSASGYFIGQTRDANGLLSSTTVAYTNTITIDSDGNAVIVTSGGAYLRYNSASNQKRFRYYSSGTYENQKAIALYALENSARTPAELSFSASTAEAFIGQIGFTGPQLTKIPADIPVTWSSSQPSVASIDLTSGEIHLNNAGETIITASFAGNSEYAPATAFYTLTVNPAYTIILQNVTDGKVFVDAANSSSVKFKVTSSYAWESSVSFESSFNNSFAVTPTQNGAGEVEVTVNCSVENTSEDDRQLGTITISNDGDEKTIQVWQFGFSDEPIVYRMSISSSSIPANSHCDVVWYNSTSTTLTHNGITWSGSVEGTDSFIGANDRCTIGKKDSPATKIILSTTGFAGKTIVAARLKGSCTSEEGPVLSIFAGSTTMLDNCLLVKSTSNPEVYESSTGNVALSSGEALTFEITSSVAAGISIYYVEVEYR